MILTQVGHIGIDIKDKSYKLVPSLAAMSSLADPIGDLVRITEKACLETAYNVMIECSDDKSISDYLGSTYMKPILINWGESYKVKGSEIIGYNQYDRLSIPDYKVLIMAQNLLYHGVVGDFKERASNKADSSNYTTKFDALLFANIAIVHLGVSNEDAWGMTMTQIRHAIATKFPPSKEDLAKDSLLENYDKMMEMRERIYGSNHKSKTL